jgi:hypothetical protein
MENVFIDYTRKPRYYVEKNTCYKNFKRAYHNTPKWHDMILACVASGGHHHLIRKYLEDEHCKCYAQMAYVAIAGNNHYVISLLQKHIPESIIEDKYIIHTLSRGNMVENHKTIKYYYQLYPHRNIVDDIDFYHIYRSGYMPLFIFYNKYINETNVKKLMDLRMTQRNLSYKHYMVSRSENHINIIVKLHINKHYINNIKRAQIDNIIKLLHEELKYDSHNYYTQFAIIRMIIKYCKIFQIKKMRYFNMIDNKSERDLISIGYYTKNISCYYLTQDEHNKILHNIKKFTL